GQRFTIRFVISNRDRTDGKEARYEKAFSARSVSLRSFCVKIVRSEPARSRPVGWRLAGIRRRVAPCIESTHCVGRSHAREEFCLAPCSWSALYERSLHAHYPGQLFPA